MSNETHPVPPVSGYRPLTQQQVDVMNEGKAVFNALGAYLDKLASYSPAIGGSLVTDPRCIELARTDAQAASMWAMRAITRPSGFA